MLIRFFPRGGIKPKDSLFGHHGLILPTSWIDCESAPAAIDKELLSGARSAVVGGEK